MTDLGKKNIALARCAMRGLFDDIGGKTTGAEICPPFYFAVANKIRKFVA